MMGTECVIIIGMGFEGKQAESNQLQIRELSDDWGEEEGVRPQKPQRAGGAKEGDQHQNIGRVHCPGTDVGQLRTGVHRHLHK